MFQIFFKFRGFKHFTQVAELEEPAAEDRRESYADCDGEAGFVFGDHYYVFSEAIDNAADYFVVYAKFDVFFVAAEHAEDFF